MNGKWVLETHGDPLGRLHAFVGAVWERAELEGLLVPLGNGRRDQLIPSLLTDPLQLQQVNPFKPLMLSNAARDIPRLLSEHPGAYLGAMFRPCEMRSLVEMVKHDAFHIKDLLTICVDCLATLPAGEYRWRAERKGERGALTAEALQFARQGGIVPYRYRRACQICLWPEACAIADITVGVLGLPVRRHLLIGAGEATADRLQMNTLVDGEAPPELVAQHERVVARLVQRRHETRQRLIGSLEAELPHDPEEIVRLFADCDECQRCLAVCPICAVEFPQRDEEGRYTTEGISRWLVSCAGCGMCEQVCPRHYPLSAIFGLVREKLGEAAGYVPGHSAVEALPVP